MLAELKKSWQTFESAPPGGRFEKLHEARKRSDGVSRIAFAAMGGLLLAGGVVLLFIPGPGLLLIAFGGARVAQQSLWLARILDRLELTHRKLLRKARSFWNRSSTGVRTALVAGTAL
jgi:hypothetical protein